MLSLHNVGGFRQKVKDISKTTRKIRTFQKNRNQKSIFNVTKASQIVKQENRRNHKKCACKEDDIPTH